MGPGFENVSLSRARLLSGDFDGDGRDDLVLLGKSATGVPLSFSNGNGTLRPFYFEWGTGEQT